MSLILGLGFKMVPRWLKMAPSSTRYPQAGPKRIPSWPRWLQSCSNKASKSPKIAQRCPRWPQHGPRLSKMSVSGCFGLSSLAVSGASWPGLRFALALPSLCFCIAFALPSLFIFLSNDGAPLSYKAIKGLMRPLRTSHAL